MQSLSAPRWRCVQVDALVWRVWDGEYVVRDERTGSTHLLSPLAGAVLEELTRANTGSSAEDLALSIHPSSFAAGVDRVAAVGEVLSEFRRIGLAESDAR